ncbi:hypothetical protein H4R33_006864 [Dimargaris cristalligena]|nr:hypothetical protein H4R33_006864 [Dimargaris cristalligena]
MSTKELTYVCIAPQPVDDPSAEAAEFRALQLPHPSTGEPHLFYQQGPQLCELNAVAFNHEKSWFVDNAVQSDGTLHLMTPVDPLYILLPILEINNQNRDGFDGVYMMADDLLESPEFPDIAYLRTLPQLWDQLRLLCDVKQITADESVYRLSEKKATDWLVSKVEAVCETLSTYPDYHHVNKHVFFLDNAANPGYMEKKKQLIVDMIGEYLNNTWLERLLDRYNNFAELEALKNRSGPQYNAQERPEDYASKGPRPTKVDQQGPAKKAKMTPAVRKLAKADTKGMKSMLCFFKKT